MKTLLSVLFIVASVTLGAFLPPTKHPKRIDTSSRHIDSLIEIYKEESLKEQLKIRERVDRSEDEIRQIKTEMPPYEVRAISVDPFFY